MTIRSSLRFLYIFGGSGLLCGTPKTPLTTAMRDCWILLICTVMVTSRRPQWPQTHRTFDSWIILWNAIGETRVLVFITFWFFGIWRVSILLHIIPRSFGVVHCHYESLEWIIYFLRKSEFFLIIQNTYNQWSFQVCFENDWQIRKWDGTDLEKTYQEEAGFSQPSYHNLGFLSEKPYTLDCNYCKQK